MDTKLPLYKKLTIVLRVEPGCLGPQGKTHIEEFCRYAKSQLKPIEKGLLRWVIKPRYDKSLPELEYEINNVSLTSTQATEFFTLYEKNRNVFEETVDEKLVDLVEEYFQRT